jgi:murein DD-endopeptidase MepM/ murein hydrolase activator NlpD
VPQHRAEGPALKSRAVGDLPGRAEAQEGRGAPAHRRDTAGQRPLAGRLLSAPVLVGAAALALASAGAVTAGAARSGALPLPNRPLTRLSTASLAGATPGTARSLRGAWTDREKALSRGAQRVAVQATEPDLQTAAQTQARRRSAALAVQAVEARKQAQRIAARAWHLPVTRGAYHLTAGFGQCSGLWSHCHTGLDFAAPEGTPIHAVAAGTITEVAWAGSYGNRTIERLPDGTELWYAHQSATAVSAGQKVSGGQVIGSVGSTGNTTGPHVHLEVRPRPDEPVDPETALVRHGITP